MMTDFQEKGFSLGQTVKNTLACEATIKNMAMESSSMLMAINIKGIGKMGKEQVRASTNIPMEISMKVSGQLI